jgi:hypothetical protein
MFIFMTAEGIPNSDQVEIRVFVDKSQAEPFLGDLGALAAYYGGTVIAPAEKPQLAIAPETELPTRPFRKEMTTDLYEEGTSTIVTAVTLEDFKHFAKSHGNSPILATTTFNALSADLHHTLQITNGRQGGEYFVKGSLVAPANPKGPKRPTQVNGFRVEFFDKLADRIAETKDIPRFATGARRFFKDFTQELFAPDDNDAS